MNVFVSLFIGILIGAMIWPLYAVFHYLSYVKRRRQYFIYIKEYGMDTQANPQRFNNIWEALEDDEEEQKRLTITQNNNKNPLVKARGNMTQ